MKVQLQKRQEMNPRYSLRSFAKKLAISPSKVSELLSGKTKISVERAEDIAHRLGLTEKERELFVLSAQLVSSSKKAYREELEKQIQSLSAQINAGRTTQRNAWYFGAVNALEDSGFDSKSLRDQLALTTLQIENAKRFRNRIRRFYPERTEFSFEPASVIKRIEEEHYSESDSILDVDFVFLSDEQLDELRLKIKRLLQTTKSKGQHPANPETLRLIHWGALTVVKK